MRAVRGKWIVQLPEDCGQTMLMTLLVLGLFLLGAIAFGVDYANVWFHRQAAQNAADAACTAGAMDLLYNAQDYAAPASPANAWGWISAIGNNNVVDCNGNTSTYAPCWYAMKNGYGAGTLGQVELRNPTNSMKTSLGISSCDSSTPSGQFCIPPTNIVANPFLQVNVDDTTPLFFAGLISGKKSTQVGARAVCGVVAVQQPVPLLVLNPTLPQTLLNKGNVSIAIYGGPNKSVQVNSSNTQAVQYNGASGNLCLVQGGPPCNGGTTGPGCGSIIGITGNEPAGTGYATSTATSCATASSSIVCSPTNPSCAVPNSPPVSDPLAQTCAPGQSGGCLQQQAACDGAGVTNPWGCSPPTQAQISALPIWPKTGSGTVPAKTDGCPASSGPCEHFVAGAYPGGIQIKNVTAVFDPGLYYVTGGLTLDANSHVCPNTIPTAGDGTGGVTFYFADGNSVSVAANSGSSTDPCTNKNGQPLTIGDVLWPGATQIPANLSTGSILYGNILLAPFKGYYGDPNGSTDEAKNFGEQRGILFFQNRSYSANPNWQGGGAFTLAGTMYFHYCDSSIGGGGVNCSQSAGYTTQFSLGGNPASGTYILGDIITDELILNGNPTITMDLDPYLFSWNLKASLLQ